MLKSMALAGALLAGAAGPVLAQAQAQSAAAEAPALRPDQVQFRALYKELVETNTTLSAGSCTLAAAKMAAHLKAAGYSDADMGRRMWNWRTRRCGSRHDP